MLDTRFPARPLTRAMLEALCVISTGLVWNQLCWGLLGAARTPAGCGTLRALLERGLIAKNDVHQNELLTTGRNGHGLDQVYYVTPAGRHYVALAQLAGIYNVVETRLRRRRGPRRRAA